MRAQKENHPVAGKLSFHPPDQFSFVTSLHLNTIKCFDPSLVSDFNPANNILAPADEPQLFHEIWREHRLQFFTSRNAAQDSSKDSGISPAVVTIVPDCLG